MDPQCELLHGDTATALHVYEDYSIKLLLQDVEYSVGKIQDKVIKLQLLERDDEKKWWVWMANGLLSQNRKLATKNFPFFSKVDAIAMFEKKFEQATENRWIEREFF